MKVLMLSTDKGALKWSGSVFERIISYGTLCDELVIVVAGGKGEVLKVGQNVFVYGTKHQNRLSVFFEMISLGLRMSRQHGFSLGDVVTSQDPFELGCIAYIITRVRKLALHLQVHIDFFSPYYKKESLRQRSQAWIAEWLLPRADSVRVVSEKIRTYLISRGISGTKVACVPIFTDWKKIQDAPVTYNVKGKYPNAEPLILSASRLVKQKNIPLTIEAFSLVQKKYPNAQLLIVGKGGEQDRIKALIQARNLTDVVHYEDWTDDMASYLKTADIFVLSSDYEGWGLSVVEACAAGCPVVMTDVGCAGEFLINGENGSVVPVRDVNALTKALEQLINSQELREKISSTARASVTTLTTHQEYMEAIRQSWVNATHV